MEVYKLSSSYQNNSRNNQPKSYLCPPLETLPQEHPSKGHHKDLGIQFYADILREHGVPDSKIAYWILRQPRCMTCHPVRFRKVVEDVVEMGFDASTMQCAIAVTVSQANKSKCQCKVDTYKKCGFAEEEVSKAFRCDPHCMLLSVEKIEAGMDFFANKMRWNPSVVATHPKVLGHSLKRRIIPRCPVFKFLVSRGLVTEKVVNLTMLLSSSEERFLKKYVEPYRKEGPELLKLYKEKL